MEKEKSTPSIWPALLLFIMSPLIAELFCGSTPISRAGQLFPEAFLYGSGAILVREFARWNKLGWNSIILLGTAFGVIEECFLMQSVFNPHFLGFDFSYGRMLGTNWIWAQTIIVYHALWSITIPVLFIELLFPSRRDKPWLKRWGTALVILLFLISCVAFFQLFRKMSGFSATFTHFAGAGLVTALLITLAIKAGGRQFALFRFKTPPAIAAGIISFVACVLWFICESTVFTKGYGIAVWMVQIAIIFILAVVLILVSGWIHHKWNDLYRFSLAWGALLAGQLFGLNNLVSAKNRLDIVSQLILILITNILLVLMWKKRASQLALR